MKFAAVQKRSLSVENGYLAASWDENRHLVVVVVVVVVAVDAASLEVVLEAALVVVVVDADT